MSDNQRNRLPTGSSGGGGKRGYGVRSFYAHPDSNEVRTGERCEKKNITVNDDLEELKDFKIWMEQEEEGLQLNGTSNTEVPLPTIGSGYVNNVDVPRPHDVEESSNMFCDAIAGTGSSLFQTLNQALIDLEEHVNAQAMPHQANAFCNANEPLPQEENGDQHDEQGAVNGNRPVEEPDEPEDPNSPPPLEQIFYKIPVNDLNLINYVFTTMEAYLCQKGQLLSDCLSLRDSHIFLFLNRINYLPYIWQICHVPSLTEAMLHHLQVVKALMSNNLGVAVHHQRLLVDAVNELLNESYQNEEVWTIPSLRTSRYDLRIVTEKADEAGRQRTPQINLQWSFVDSIQCVQLGACTCHYISYISRTSQFFRR